MKYALSGGHQKTIEAAEIILKLGGNAVDAAIAAYLVSFVSEPCMASIGAGGFAMVNDGHSTKLVDFFCHTPKNKKPIGQQDFFPITVDFGNVTEDFHVGHGSIAVPGAIAGIYKMHEIWGSTPMSELIEPALLWSKEGIIIDKFQGYDFQLLKEIFALEPDVKDIFFNKNGDLKNEGDIIRMPHYHDFLEVLKHEGQDFFYKGDIAQIISTNLESRGHLTRADFENYKAIVRDPLQFNFLGNRIFTPGFPSVGGQLIAAILNTFQQNVNDKKIDFLSETHFNLIKDLFKEISSLNNSPEKISQYLNVNFGINSNYEANHRTKKWGGTSHFNIVDNNGTTVALTTSIGEGSGYFIPGTDMQMNNMLGEEALMPNGFHNWQENVRLQSMMSPTIVIDPNNHAISSIGSGGAGRIPYAICQVLINLLYFNQTLNTAVESPRIHTKNEFTEAEIGFDLNNINLNNINLWDQKSLFFGGTNIIKKNKDNIQAIADSRRYGAVI